MPTRATPGRPGPLAQVGPQAAGALRFACRLRALRSARQQPVDYLRKRAASRTRQIVATWGDQFWMSPPDQFWMSFDTVRLSGTENRHKAMQNTQICESPKFRRVPSR
jgi:hypothetical protein